MPCTKGRGRVQELLKDELLSGQVRLLLISVDEDREAISAYIRRHQVEEPVAWDRERRFTTAVSNASLPHYVILKGNTVWPFDFPRYGGWRDEFYADLAWFVRQHCGQERPASRPQNGR